MLLLDEQCSPLQIHDLQYDLFGEIDNSMEKNNEGWYGANAGKGKKKQEKANYAEMKWNKMNQRMKKKLKEMKKM